MAPTDTVWKNDKARLPVNLLGMTPVSAQFAAICDISIGYMLHRCPAVCVCPGRAVNGHVFPQDRRDFPLAPEAARFCCLLRSNRCAAAPPWNSGPLRPAWYRGRKADGPQDQISARKKVSARNISAAGRLCLGCAFFDLRLCRFMALCGKYPDRSACRGLRLATASWSF